MKRDRVRLFEQSIEVDGAGASSPNRFVGQKRIGDDNFVAKRRCAMGKRPGDAAEPNQAECLTTLAVKRSKQFHVPAAAAGLIQTADDATRECQDQRQAVIGNLLDTIIRDVRDLDAARGRDCQGDRVNPDAIARYDPAVLHGLDDVGGERPVAVQYRVRIPSQFQQLGVFD